MALLAESESCEIRHGLAGRIVRALNAALGIGPMLLRELMPCTDISRHPLPNIHGVVKHHRCSHLCHSAVFRGREQPRKSVKFLKGTQIWIMACLPVIDQLLWTQGYK